MTIPPMPAPVTNLATLVASHAQGSAAVLVTMHRPDSTDFPDGGQS